MILKIRTFSFMLLLIMLFSGVVCGENLLIGGINQDQMAIDDNTAYAKQISATYVPTYTGSVGDNVNEVRNAALGKPTVQNGLSLEELGAKGPKHYDTIVAYSGGTASAVTALDKQGVTCDTLILISPMAAGVPDSYLVGTGVAIAVVGTVTGAAAAVGATTAASGPAAFIARSNYNAQINRILEGKDPAVKNIVVIQSPEDNLLFGYVYQYRFLEGANPQQITVHNIDLKSTGKETVHELIFDYAKANLKTDNNGKVYYAPSQPTLNQESNAFKKPSLAKLLRPEWSSQLSPTPDWDTSNDQGPGACPTGELIN